MSKSKITKAIRFPDGEAYPYDKDLWEDTIAAGRAVLLTGKAAHEAVTKHRREYLLRFITPGSTLQAVCTHENRSGMSSHHYRVFVPVLLPDMKDGQLYIQEITRPVAELCGLRLSSHGHIIMGGCGYSKSFEIGYALGLALWPQGTDEPHGVRNGEPDRNGGYALKVNS